MYNLGVIIMPREREGADINSLMQWKFFIAWVGPLPETPPDVVLWLLANYKAIVWLCIRAVEVFETQV